MKKLVLTLALVFGVLAANAQYFGVVNWGYFTMMHRKIP